MNAGGVPMRVCMQFVLNPSMKAYTWEIAKRYDLDSKSVRLRLRPAVLAGFLTATKEKGMRGMTYQAGPELLREIGR